MIDFKKYLINRTNTLFQALEKLDILSKNNVLTLFVIDQDGKICGTVTDGDIRRGFISGATLSTEVEKVMNSDFVFFIDKRLEIDKYKEVKLKGLKLIPVVDEQFHIVDVYDLTGKKNHLPIDAVLMAGGKGERLRPLTETRPKPLLKVADKCIIDYNVENLASYGVRNIFATVNYLKEQIEEHFLEPVKGVKVNCVSEPQFLGTIGSAKLVGNFVNDTVLVMNSDLFTNINLEDFFFHFLENDADMSIAAIPYTVDIPYAVFELDGREILSLKEKPTYHYYANAGIYLIKRECLDFIPPNICFHATDLIEVLLKMKKKVIRFPHTGYWIDIGRPEDFKKVQDFAKHIK